MFQSAESDDLHVENCDFPLASGDFFIEHGVPIETCDCQSLYSSWWVQRVTERSGSVLSVLLSLAQNQSYLLEIQI